MIRLEDKKIEMYTHYIPAYILTFFLDYDNRKNIKAEMTAQSAFFISKKYKWRKKHGRIIAIRKWKN